MARKKKANTLNDHSTPNVYFDENVVVDKEKGKEIHQDTPEQEPQQRSIAPSQEITQLYFKNPYNTCEYTASGISLPLCAEGVTEDTLGKLKYVIGFRGVCWVDKVEFEMKEELDGDYNVDVNVTFSANTEPSVRDITLTVYYKGMSTSAAIEQGCPANLSVQPCEELGSDGHIINLAITYDGTTRLSATTSDNFFSHVLVPADNKTLRFTVASNTGETSREGIITVTDGVISADVHVNQKVNEKLFLVHAAQQDIHAKYVASSFTISVNSNITNITATPTQKWITCNVSNKDVNVTVSKNDAHQERQAYIVISNGMTSIACKVTQARMPKIYFDDNGLCEIGSSDTVFEKGIHFEDIYESACTISAPSISLVSDLAIKQDENGNYTLTGKTSQNEGQKRSFTITVVSKSDAEVYARMQVSQMSYTNKYINLSYDTSHKIPFSGESGFIVNVSFIGFAQQKTVSCSILDDDYATASFDKDTNTVSIDFDANYTAQERYFTLSLMADNVTATADFTQGFASVKFMQPKYVINPLQEVYSVNIMATGISASPDYLAFEKASADFITGYTFTGSTGEVKLDISPDLSETDETGTLKVFITDFPAISGQCDIISKGAFIKFVGQSDGIVFECYGGTNSGITVEYSDGLTGGTLTGKCIDTYGNVVEGYNVTVKQDKAQRNAKVTVTAPRNETPQEQACTLKMFFIGHENAVSCTASIKVKAPWLITYETTNSSIPQSFSAAQASINNDFRKEKWYYENYGEILIYEKPVSISRLFKQATYLKKVTLPSSIKTIAISSFEDCTNLSSVTFDDESSISLAEIGPFAFKGTKLKKVDFIDNVKFQSTGNGEFSGCTSLSSVTLSADNTVLPKFIFHGCTSLKSIDISNVSSIGANAFVNCTSLSSISLSNAATIDQYAFSDCTSLTSVTLSMPVDIGPFAFANCTSLQSADIPHGSNVSYASFKDCGFEEITVKKDVNYFYQDKNSNGGQYSNNLRLKKIIIEEGVNSLTNFMFNLVDVSEETFPLEIVYSGKETLRTIPLQCFSNRHFKKVDNLPTLVLPSSLNTIGPRICAMSDLAVIRFKCNAGQLTSLDDNAFDGLGKNGALFVPQGQSYAYEQIPAIKKLIDVQDWSIHEDA